MARSVQISSALARPLGDLRQIGPRLARLRRSDQVALALAAIALLAGAALRLHAIGADDRLSSDELGYIGAANRLITLSGYGSFHWAPGTPILFTVVAWLSGHSEISAVTHSHGIAQYVQWLVEVTTLGVAGAIAWRLAGCWAALLAVLGLATYGPLIAVTHSYLSEPLGGLMALVMVGVASYARAREWRWLVAAGALGGLACLAREDLVPGLVTLTLALALARTGSRRRALRRATIYLAAALVTLAPWVAFASVEQHTLVAITTGGTDSLFIGTYLPGDGSQFQTVEAFRPAVCRRFPSDCNTPPGDAAPMFALITAQHPGDSRNQAITAAVLSNLRKYMLGRPLSFAALLARKLWGMWSAPWSGGNGTRLAPAGIAASLDLAAVAAAWLGLLLALWLCRRRWSVIVPALALLAIVFFNDWFGPAPRDTLRLVPLLFVLGASGLTIAAKRIANTCSRG